ncbi:NAD(P)H-dependent oxidoreductase [Candidatus Magnetominusculus dajiuhuensis]|uniref:NAD(P)H-dependent oxidoreductase n=1 Tax=Candidatus Magnetominusculus dajiuhuensis TaxID=3137712 RepID=UPI003B42BAB2
MKEDFLKAMQFRHACKVFDEGKKIPEEHLRFILEAGRLSPSSFGLEHWRFIVVRTQELKERLKEACFNQVQLTTCSDAVAIAAKVEDLRPGSEYVEARFACHAGRPDVLAWVRKFYADFYSGIDVRQWSITQCHIAAANMMTAAAFVGIDSCPIGGLSAPKVMEALGLDHAKYDVALIVPFGYRLNPQPPKYRLAFDDIVEFR